MPENRRSEGKIITLENAVAASNMVAGQMVAWETAVNTVYSCEREVAGFTGSAGAGTRCLGILDTNVSAAQVTFNVWTEGVFEFQLASAIATAATIGQPVFPCVSGGGLLVETSGTTGEFPVGVVVGVSQAGGISGTYVQVKINPGAYRCLGMGIAPDTGYQTFGGHWGVNGPQGL